VTQRLPFSQRWWRPSLSELDGADKTDEQCGQADDAPLAEYPSSASSDSAPGPATAAVNLATPQTKAYSYPPLVMKNPRLT
jgi:hypothetical protein